MTTTTVPFRQWMDKALQHESSNNLSPECISAALRIAISLAEQVDSSEDGVLSPPFPMSRVDWADCIEVSLKTSDNLLDSASQDLQTDNAVACQRGEHGPQEVGVEQSIPSHLNVAGAQILHNDHSQTNTNTTLINGELQRMFIYSLGLVFYQLFSLGQVPLTPELLVVSCPNGELRLLSSCSRPVNDRETINNNGEAAPLDNFAVALNVSADHKVNGNGMKRPTRESESSPLNGSTNIDGNGEANFETVSNVSGDQVNGNNIKRSTRESEPSAAKRQISVSTRSTISSCGIVSCDLPIDLLRMQGVPSSLCDLIYNMIDCINGDLMGNDSYTKISDVAMDLQLMLQKPSIYLDPLNMDKIVEDGLGLDETRLIGKDQEFSALQSAYQRSTSGSSELALITGLSGTGKTMLANQFGSFVTANGGLFFSGKFDQMGCNSFPVIASAFDKYCEELAREESTVQSVLVAFKLREALGDDVHYLTRMIPNLSKILNEEVDETFSNQECIDAQRRIHYLLTQFVDVICECSEKPIVLFVDDLQWADSASISIVNQLLHGSPSRQNGKFFFLGSLRDDEVGNDHPFWSIIQSTTSFGYTITKVMLEYLTEQVVKQFISDLLHTTPRQVARLSDIVFRRTKGNPLYVSKMLLSLNRKGLLYVSLRRNRWEWDEEKIVSEKIPDDVAMFFVAAIKTLDADMRLALSTLSCFGNSVRCVIIDAIQADLSLNLTGPLDDAIGEGLLYKMNGKYCFGHDRIQEAAYSIIDEHEMCLHHMKYGVSTLSDHIV